ncbi:hypothetical protein CERZMDRAFT_109393 [Cercospora zeae-maydis SCOH1-5]|uniref:SAC domain-containing protein n=1 Tax=Cercospora zeae-maydis SCOH1-5 TaxID=717836 RepID=A0A6A6FTA4_9PEZI|nr:hypothetical protein CERZMDRAFT_109393 [Cercospora zeae-maydis SCOH1-5]
MPGLARQLLIFAAVDGLIVQSAGHRGGGATRIEYGTNNITAVSEKDRQPEGSDLLEAHGLIVAQWREKPVFRVTDVTLIPLASRAEAASAIAHAERLLHQKTSAAEHDTEDSDVGEEVETGSVGTDAGDNVPEQNPEEESTALEAGKPGIIKQRTTIVKDVVQQKGTFGRFATSWFSKRGTQSNSQRQSHAESGESNKEQEKHEAEPLPDADNSQAAEIGKLQEEPKGMSSTERRRQSAIDYLAPRIVKSARLYFSTSGFYFSYDHDLSRSLGRDVPSSSTLPLWKRSDDLFFWNWHLCSPLANAGQDSLVLALIQGFVGQRAFSVTPADDQVIVAEPNDTELTDFNEDEASREPEKHNFHVTLISRRSVKRAGLRYLRRGVDDQGNVANSVETEQILSTQVNDSARKTFSLLQYRGSMPLFFSQSPYSFKPTAIMFGSESTNQAAFQKHFKNLATRYGDVQAASLIDKRGTELNIGVAYEEAAKKLNENGGIDGKPLGFQWFDFHGECKGMRFDKVNLLVNSLKSFLTSSAFTVEQGGAIKQKQTGILRTNCMDCLDRTNVTQSAVGGWALQQQLQELGLNIDLQSDPKTQWFNVLWADNGDAISKQYAGTAALKGDFTRTRKRNWAGALSDFSLTLNRYYNNIFGDYFLQTNIDYFLGASPSVFDEFETNMTSQDYALDMGVVRQNAIETCIKLVLEDPNEDLISAWTLSCPRTSNTLRSLPFEDCVILLTAKALYLCRFDWDTDKVGSFERVDLLDVQEIWRGAYITSTLGASHLDETRNHGFALRYTNQGPSTVRTNTRSMSVAPTSTEGATATAEAGGDGPGVESRDMQPDSNRKQHTSPGKGESRVLAFKALPPKQSKSSNSTSDLANLSEVEATKRITDELERAVNKARQQDYGASFDTAKDAVEVRDQDVISASEARKSTSYVESLGYSLKKLVWS